MTVRITEAEEGGDQWTVLHHPAIDSSGAALWPDRYPLEDLERVRRNMTPRDWSALFQGAPAPEEGDFFKEPWFNWYDEPPAHLVKYGASDYAITVRDGDWTVHGVAGVDPNDDLYVLDVWRQQVDSLTGVEAAIDMMATHKPMAWVEEKAQIEKAIGPFIKKRQRERKEYTFRVQLPTTGDKMARAQSFRARAAQGKVYLPKNAPWVTDYLQELLMFPNGTHDDQVDVSGLFGRILDKMSTAQRPPAGKELAGLTFDEAVAQDRVERDRFAHTTRHIP